MRIRTFWMVMVIGALMISGLTPTKAAETGYVRVIHTAADLPPVDVYFNSATPSETPFAAKLAFGASSGDFAALEAGVYEVVLRPAGAPASDKPVYSQKGIAVPANASLNVAIMGLYLSKVDRTALKVSAFLTERNGTNGKARVEFFNAATDVQPLDIVFGGKTLSQVLPYERRSITQNITPTTGDLVYQQVGQNKTVVLSVPNVAFGADTIYSVILVGQAKANTLKAVILTTTALASSVRFINAVSDLPAVDIYVGSATTPVASAVAYGVLPTGTLSIPSGIVTLAIREAGATPDSKPLLEARATTLRGGELTTVLLVGLRSGKSLQALRVATLITDRAAFNGNARLDVFNAIPDSGLLDIDLGTQVAFRNVLFGRSSVTLTLSPMITDLSAFPINKKTPLIAEIKGLEIKADTAYTVILLGQVADKSVKTLTLSSTLAGAVNPVPTVQPTAAATLSPTSAPTTAATSEATAVPTPGK